MFDPNYKLKHRVTPIRRLAKYEEPLRMAGDPTNWDGWEERCRVIYAHMMAIKHGAIPPALRRGLWFYATHSD